jgi:hypothetical protein
MSQSKTHNRPLEEELEDLRKKFSLQGKETYSFLEGDRKAFYQTSQTALKRNREKIN